MTKLTPKEANLIEDVIRSANPLFFGKLAKLLSVPYPVTREEKQELMRKIQRRWEKAERPDLMEIHEKENM